VEVNKRYIEKDTEEEQVIRIKKGVTLTPLDKIENDRLLLKDIKDNFYYLVMESHGSESSDTVYNTTRIDKLSEDFNPQKHITGSIWHQDCFYLDDKILYESLKSRLVVNFDKTYDMDDNFTGNKGKFRLDGDPTDRLIRTVLRFVKLKGRNHES
jgi:hypothetical protein